MAPSSQSETTEFDNSGLSDVVSLINKLQDVVTASNLPPEFLSLPQMVVVGEQSAGKSSVLENIVGKDFLPRGTGIVTRCPLVLQLIQCEEDYAEFLHLQGTRFTNYGDVRREIQIQTDKQAGRSKAISSQPINLKVYSPTVPNLTLVDLPGLTKNPVGDQPPNIEEIIRELILSYIKQENTLILAVTSATQDLVSSDSLQLAKTVDPHRLRTIGIITKVDMMDNGTNARSVLKNEVISLKRGYIGLVNRSQNEIDSGVTIPEAQKKEKRFFSTHAAYRDMAKKLGSNYLQERLSEQLCQHIKEKLPQMKSQVRKEHQRAKQLLEAMKVFEEQDDESWMSSKVVEVVQKFIKAFQNDLEGLTINADGNKLSSGAKMNDCFYEQIHPLLNQPVLFDKKELYTLWKNMVGFQNIMFFTQQAFINIVKKYLQQFKDPLETATSLATEIVKNAVTEGTEKIATFPYLQQEVLRLVIEELGKNEDITKKQLADHLKSQKAFINNYHPDFMKQPSISNQANNSVDTDIPKANSADKNGSDLSLNESELSYIFNKRNEVMSGRITVHHLFPKSSQPLYFILTQEKLAWFKNEYESRPQGIVSVEGVSVIQVKGRKDSKRYLLQKQSLRKNEQLKLTISFSKPTDEESWLDAFHIVEIDVIQENKTDSKTSTFKDDDSTQNEEVPDADTVFEQSDKSVSLSSTNDPRHDYTNDHVLDEVSQKLCSYAMIIDETIHDITPKYISYFLIHKTIKYAKYKLLSDVQKENITTLMRISDEQLSKREEWFRIYNATHDALKMMGEVSGGKSFKNATEATNEEVPY